MIIYQRRIATKLTALRILAAVIISGLIYSSQFHIQNLFYFLIVAAIFLSLLNVHDFIVTEEGLIVKKIYLYGLVPFAWHFLTTDEIELSGPARYGEDSDINFPFEYEAVDGPADEIALGLGCLLPFFYRPKISHIKIQIKKLTAPEKIISSVSIELNAAEYRYAKAIADGNSNG